MTPSKIWLSSPHMGGKELHYIHDAFEKNWVAPLGENVTGFESDLEKFLQSNHHVAALSSGTSALHLALIILGVQAGDEVICQTMTFSASANPIAYLGAKPVFVDSEEDTWNMSPVFLEEAIKDRIAKGKKPKAIIPVHLYGMPAKMNEIIEIANRYEIPVVEDAAEALGSSIKGKQCGTFGEMAVLSFNGNKIITTSGGGALVTTTVEEKRETVFLATQARDQAPHYQHSKIGYNYRMSNICAGIGRGQMEVLPLRIKERNANFHFYKEVLGNVPGIQFQETPEYFFSNRWLTAILVEPQLTNGIDREVIRLSLQEKNIETRPLWKPMHLQPVFKDTPYYGENVAERLFNNGLCLPSGSNLTVEEKERTKKALCSILQVEYVK